MAGHPLIQRTTTAALWVTDPVWGDSNLRSLRHCRTEVEKIANTIDAPFLTIGTEAPDQLFKLDDTVSDQIAELQKRTLILSGYLLEGAITQVALTTLLSGYDVFVCADLCVSDDVEYRKMFLRRIRDCGGHLVTQRQLLLELLAQESEQIIRDKIAALLRESVAI